MDELSNGPAFLTDWAAAETAAIDHMRSIGFVDARKTGAGADGGLDALSSDAAAQVKFYANRVTRPDVQRLRGAANDYRLALFYATGGYTREAIDYADQAGVSLFAMDVYGRCTPASSHAERLTDPTQSEARRVRIAELKSQRYRLAAVILDEDVMLFARYARTVKMDPERWALYAHVASAFEKMVRDFHHALEVRDFERADHLFEGIRNRIEFLVWITGPTLMEVHDELEDAIAEGWRADVTPRSDLLLERILLGVRTLRGFIRENFEKWKDAGETLTGNTVTVLLHSVTDVEATRTRGMLAVVAEDQTILSPQLVQQLKSSLRRDVAQIHSAAQSASRQLLRQYAVRTFAGLAHPNPITPTMLRVDCLVDRIIRQLDASDR